jgi:hypothetical protein
MPKYEVIFVGPDRIIDARTPESARFKAMELVQSSDFDVQEIEEEPPNSPAPRPA